MVKKSVSATGELNGYVSAANFSSPYRIISTGSIALDLATSKGGFPTGTVCRLKGKKSVGKSSMSYKIVKNALDMGMGVMIADSECSYDKGRAYMMGITEKNWDKMIVSQPKRNSLEVLTIEQVIRDVDTFAASSRAENGFLLVVDSYDMLYSNNRAQATEEKALMADKVVVLSRWMPRLIKLLKAYDSTALFINQARANLVPMSRSPTTYTGGFALEHASTIEVELTAVGQLKGSDGLVDGKEIKATLQKNKIGPAYRSVQYNLLNGIGIDTAGEIVDIGCVPGIDVVKKAGHFYTIDGKKFNSREAVREALYANEEWMEEMRQAIMSAAAGNTSTVITEEEEEVDTSDFVMQDNHIATEEIKEMSSKQEYGDD